MDETEREGEAVFIAANVEEAEFVERLLEREGIDYDLRPEAFTKAVSGTCLLGVLFEVLPGQAAYCRNVLTAAGLERGVVDGEE